MTALPCTELQVEIDALTCVGDECTMFTMNDSDGAIRGSGSASLVDFARQRVCRATDGVARGDMPEAVRDLATGIVDQCGGKPA